MGNPYYEALKHASRSTGAYMSSWEDDTTKMFHACPRCGQRLGYCTRCNKVLSKDEHEKYADLIENKLAVYCSRCTGIMKEWANDVEKIGVEGLLRRGLKPEYFEKFMKEKENGTRASEEKKKGAEYESKETMFRDVEQI